MTTAKSKTKTATATEATLDFPSANTETINSIRRILEIFQASDKTIRPHFILTGPSGSGKSHTLALLCELMDLPLVEVNAAGLTKEGTAGNSVSKALSPLVNMGSRPVVCFVDEFDKLFISGNSNSDLAHETTNGVQNEFLKVIEGSASVYGDYGKYINIRTDNVLFVFAGAFNGEENMDLDRLRELGIKTEFLGRVGLTYGLAKVTLEDLRRILESSPLLRAYLKLMPDSDRQRVVSEIMDAVEANYENNSLGVRMINTLLHQYFIEGGLKQKEVEKNTFQRTLSLTRPQ